MQKKAYENLKRIKKAVEDGTATFKERNVLKIHLKNLQKKNRGSHEPKKPK